MNIVCLGMMGVAMLVLGLYIRAGGFKTWYLARGTPIIIPRAIQNMLIPLGLSFIAAEVITSDLIPTKSPGDVFFWIVMSMFIASIALGIWNPRWLQPRWLVYLEDEYGTVMWHLLQEAAQDPKRWEQQVRTQEDLETWAEETRKKLGYPPHPGRIEQEAKERNR